MTKTVLKEVRDTLLADSTLTTLLGGNYVFVAEIMQAKTFPSITIRLTSEGSKKRVGYGTFKKRDNTPMIQCDIWSRKSREETYDIADRLDKLLVANTVSGTQSWIKVSDGDMFEQDTRIYHKPVRYSFAYVLDDS